MDGLFGKSDPYLKILRVREDNSWVPVFQSEIIKSNLNPVFKPARMRMQLLCNSDPSAVLRFQVWDWDKNSPDDLIGEFDTSVKELLQKTMDGKVSSHTFILYVHMYL